MSSIIVDQFGRPYPTKARPEKTEIAPATIYLSQREYVTAGLTPGRLAAIFKEADAGDLHRQFELFEALEEKDAHIIGEMGKRRNVVNEINFLLEPASEDKRDIKIYEFVKEALDAIPDFEDIHVCLQDSVGKGFAALDIGWDVSEGQAVPRTLDALEQSRFKFAGADGYVRNVPLLISDEFPLGSEIPAWRVIFHKYGGKSGNGTRSGVYRVCAWMFLFKNYSIKDWVVFCEVFGQPLRLGKYEPGVSDADKKALFTAIRAIGTDAAGCISKSTEIEFIETNRTASGGQLWENLISFCNREESKAIIGHAASADSKSPGSFAADKVKDMVRKDLIKADTRAVGRTVRSQLIRPLVGFNFGWDAAIPKYSPDLEEQDDLDKKSIWMSRMIDKGLKIPVKWARMEFGVPELKKDEEYLIPISNTLLKTPETAKLGPGTGVKSYQVAKSQRGGNQGKEAIQKLEDQLENEAGNLTDKMIDRIKDLVNSASSFAEIQERLGEVFPDADTEDMAALLRQAFIVAELTGRAHVMEE